MERWLTPPNIADHNLTENFKFKIYPGHGKMIDPFPPPISPEILITQKTFNSRE